MYIPIYIYSYYTFNSGIYCSVQSIVVQQNLQMSIIYIIYIYSVVKSIQYMNIYIYVQYTQQYRGNYGYFQQYDHFCFPVGSKIVAYVILLYPHQYSINPTVYIMVKRNFFGVYKGIELTTNGCEGNHNHFTGIEMDYKNGEVKISYCMFC